jgi:hypothetical protein
MNKLIRTKIAAASAAAMLALALAACTNSDSPRTSIPPPSASIDLEGIVSDGPVAGGTIFILTAQQTLEALSAIDTGTNRHAALMAAASTAVLQRDVADEDQFAITVSGSLAGEAIFLIFDSTGAEDLDFADTPPNLESVAVLGTGVSSQRINISLHTSVIARQIRAQLDSDGNGSPLSSGQIRALVQAAQMSALDALGEDSVGRELYQNGQMPLDTDDDDLIHHASGELGLLIRALAASAGLTVDEVLTALAADAADGKIDGLIPALINPSEALQALAELVRGHHRHADDADHEMFAIGPCSSSAVALRRACTADVIDDHFEGSAVCADVADEAVRDACLEEVTIADAENEEECGDVFEARLAVCEAIDDTAHEPPFGMLFAAGFVDPTAIGDTVEPNPYFPLVPGNQWIYESADETITVEVLAETKLIDGITCVTVNDVVTEDGVVIEDTDDWYAQDTDGNVWYCGEIAQNYELFEGDDPDVPELVDIEGSWKHGRDGAKAGLLIPFAPEPGETIRQEVLYGEAEDVIEVLSVTATETAPGGACTGDCLQTRDFTPLEPDAEEQKFYAPGIGLIVEADSESGDRLELVEFNPG